MWSLVPFVHALTPRTLVQMAIRITTIMALVAGFAYWHMVDTLTANTKDNLTNFVAERGARESAVFKQAESNHAIFKAAFIDNWRNMHKVGEAEFAAMFPRGRDGTFRLPRAAFDGVVGADGITSRNVTAFVGPGVRVDNPDMRQRLMVMARLVERFGPAWSDAFTNLYAFGPENIVAGYWPGVAWGLEVAPDFDISGEVRTQIATPQTDPSRASVWTPLVFDKATGKWDITCVTPIDIDGRHLANVAHDLTLNPLVGRVTSDKLDGTTNMVFSNDGRLIVHPDRMDELRNMEDGLTIQSSGDARLMQIYRQVIAAGRIIGSSSTVIDDPASDAFLAMVRLDGPNWWFVTVYPKQLLTTTAVKTAQHILAAAILALLLELVMLYRAMSRQKVGINA
jgi:two-component system, sensor histidine kinase and response regulator